MVCVHRQARVIRDGSVCGTRGVIVLHLKDGVAKVCTRTQTRDE